MLTDEKEDVVNAMNLAKEALVRHSLVEGCEPVHTKSSLLLSAAIKKLIPHFGVDSKVDTYLWNFLKEFPEFPRVVAVICDIANKAPSLLPAVIDFLAIQDYEPPNWSKIAIRSEGLRDYAFGRLQDESEISAPFADILVADIGLDNQCWERINQGSRDLQTPKLLKIVIHNSSDSGARVAFEKLLERYRSDQYNLLNRDLRSAYKYNENSRDLDKKAILARIENYVRELNVQYVFSNWD